MSYFPNDKQSAVVNARVAWGMPPVPTQPVFPSNDMTRVAISQPGTTVLVESGPPVIEGATAVPVSDGGYMAALYPYAADLARRVLAQPNFWRAPNNYPNSWQLRYNAVLSYVLGRWPQLGRIYNGERLSTSTLGTDGACMGRGSAKLDDSAPLGYGAIQAEVTPLKNYTARQNLVTLITQAAQQL